MEPLEEKLKRLKLAAMSSELERVLDEASRKGLAPRQCLEWLVDLELEARKGHSVERRYRLSKLESRPGIEEFNYGHHRSRQQMRSKIERILTMEFIRTGRNLVLIGNPGTGKTFLAQVIAWKACQQNVRVLFTTAMDMLNQLTASQVDHSLVRRLKNYTEPALLIID